MRQQYALVPADVERNSRNSALQRTLLVAALRPLAGMELGAVQSGRERLLPESQKSGIFYACVCYRAGINPVFLSEAHTSDPDDVFRSLVGTVLESADLSTDQIICGSVMHG